MSLGLGYTDAPPPQPLATTTTHDHQDQAQGDSAGQKVVELEKCLCMDLGLRNQHSEAGFGEKEHWQEMYRV